MSNFLVIKMFVLRITVLKSGLTKYKIDVKLALVFITGTWRIFLQIIYNDSLKLMVKIVKSS